MSDPVRSPTFRQCCSAAIELVCGLLRPRHIDQRFIRSIADAGLPVPGAHVTVQALRDSLRDHPLLDYDLDGPPVLTFTRSHDLFGDNSVILVDLRGHTPGSIGVLAHTVASE